MRKDYNLEKRKYVIGGFITVIILIYIVRLFYLQIGDANYKARADSNAFLRRTIYPARGLVYDRNDRLIVLNKPAYDVMIIPKDVTPFDTLALCKVLGITKAQLKEKWAEMKDTRKNPGYSAYSPQKLISHLSQQDYGKLQEKLYLFPGFFIQKRAVREYSTVAGANILGNIREVSANDIENDRYYRRGDYTGDLGIEKSYETALRGNKGVEILMKDAYGRIKGKYEDGAFDVAPTSGHNLKLGIDWDLQEYGEQLMANKIGAIVAIEPATGEILCLVTSPNYDPSLLVGRSRGKNYADLVKNPMKPLYNRAIQGAYPPGSTFKPTQGLIFLQEGTVNLHTMYPCYRGYVNGLRVGCHGHGSPIALKPAIQTSCNAYFCWGLKNFIDKRGSTPTRQLEKWKDYMVQMGYGYKLGVDLPSESRGFIPNPEYYSKSFRGANWTPGRSAGHTVADSQSVCYDSQPGMVPHSTCGEGNSRQHHRCEIQGASPAQDQERILRGCGRRDAYGSIGRHMPNGQSAGSGSVWKDRNGAESPRTRPFRVHGFRTISQSEDRGMRLCRECRLRRHVRSADRQPDNREIS